MESKKVFRVSITQEGKLFVARCPELGVTSQGESLVEAQKISKRLSSFISRVSGLKTCPECPLTPTGQQWK